VNWKFWKRTKEDKNDSIVKSVPFSTLYRWYCYDIGVQNLDELDSNVGLVPISEDAKEMELQESDERVLNIAHLMPFLEGMAEISSMVFVEGQFKDMLQKTGEGLTEEEMEMMLNLISVFQKKVALAAVVGSFSAAAAIGIITIPESKITDNVRNELL